VVSPPLGTPLAPGRPRKRLEQPGPSPVSCALPCSREQPARPVLCRRTLAHSRTGRRAATITHSAHCSATRSRLPALSAVPPIAAAVANRTCHLGSRRARTAPYHGARRRFPCVARRNSPVTTPRLARRSKYAAPAFALWSSRPLRDVRQPKRRPVYLSALGASRLGHWYRGREAQEERKSSISLPDAVIDADPGGAVRHLGRARGW